MALEDLTGTKYLDSLVSANPVPGDDRIEGDDHLRGVKNTLKKTFANINGECTPTQAELNLLDGVTTFGDGFETGDAAFFYQAAAPTGWTRDVSTTNMNGAGLRITTGTGGGSVSGSHDLSNSPNQVHTHSDTFGLASFTLLLADIPSHYHYCFVSGDRNTSNPAVSSTWSAYEANSGGTFNRKYELNGTGSAASYCVTESYGGNSGHSHVVNGSVSGNTSFNFDPKYINVIRAVKD